MVSLILPVYSALYIVRNIRWWRLYHFHLLLCHITLFILLQNNSDIQRHKNLMRSIHYPWQCVQNLSYSGFQQLQVSATLWILEACIAYKEHMYTFYCKSVPTQPYTRQYLLEYGWLRHYWDIGIQDHYVMSLIVVTDKTLCQTYRIQFCSLFVEKRHGQNKFRYFQLST